MQNRTDLQRDDRSTAERIPVERVDTDPTRDDTAGTLFGDTDDMMRGDTADTTRSNGDTIRSPQGAQQAQRTPAQSAQQGDEITLFPQEDLNRLRSEWEQIQVVFVDQPRDAVRRAHDLVGSVIDRLTQSFASQRDNLESTWSSGSDVSTEDLRLALHRYRSFFNRLLST